jgi:hypothetical protein
MTKVMASHCIVTAPPQATYKTPNQSPSRYAVNRCQSELVLITRTAWAQSLSAGGCLPAAPPVTLKVCDLSSCQPHNLVPPVGRLWRIIC